jgi:acyl-CoA dehydrogenase
MDATATPATAESSMVSAGSAFLSHLLGNAGKSLLLSATGSLSPFSSSTDQTAGGRYERRLAELAANFAASADLALLFGGDMKKEEMLSGRFADAFGTLYLGYACLWYYEQNKHIEGTDAMFELAMETLLQQHHEALRGIQKNISSKSGLSAMAMRLLALPRSPAEGGSDELRQQVANLISTPSEVRTLLSEMVSGRNYACVRMCDIAHFFS